MTVLPRSVHLLWEQASTGTVKTLIITLRCISIPEYEGNVCIDSWMFTIACCLVV